MGRAWERTQKRDAAAIKIGRPEWEHGKARVAADYAVRVPDVVDAKILGIGAGIEAKAGIAAIIGPPACVPRLTFGAIVHAAGWKNHTARVKAEVPAGRGRQLAHIPCAERDIIAKADNEECADVVLVQQGAVHKRVRHGHRAFHAVAVISLPAEFKIGGEGGGGQKAKGEGTDHRGTIRCSGRRIKRQA